MMKDEPLQYTEEKKDDDPRIEIAIERTLLAIERTQLAWVRTVLSLITSGIAIDKGFEALHQARLMTGEYWLRSGHFAGLLLSISGTLLGTFAAIIFYIRIRQLNKMLDKSILFSSPGMLISILICLVGGLAIYFLLQS